VLRTPSLASRFAPLGLLDETSGMILLLVGATESATAVVRDVAKTLSVDLRVGTSPDRPDWVMAATENERRDALLRHDLPSHRVIELPELGASGPVQSDRVQGALARMLELGPIPKSTPHLARQLATLALPLLREWATWLAADEARQKIAAHVSFIRSKSGPPPKARIIFVVPDARALGVLRGLLHRLSREHHEISVVVTDESTSDAALASFEGHWGLTVGRVPRSGPGPAGVLELDVISLLEDRKPNVVVVVPHRTSPVVEGDYVKAARWLGIWSVCLPLRWDDLEASRGWRHEPPDLFAVWNEEQSRNVISTLTLPANRVQVSRMDRAISRVATGPEGERESRRASRGSRRVCRESKRGGNVAPARSKRRHHGGPCRNR
jgi:hypothetical protein